MRLPNSAEAPARGGNPPSPQEQKAILRTWAFKKLSASIREKNSNWKERLKAQQWVILIVPRRKKHFLTLPPVLVCLVQPRRARLDCG